MSVNDNPNKEHSSISPDVAKNKPGSEKTQQAEKPETHDDLEHEPGGMTFEVVEGEIEGGKKVRRKGVYLLPNLFTTGALFAGFYAIVAATNGKFEAAAIAIFVSMIFDGLDGRVARLTNTQSEFGAQYDSLSDCISFGVAPALVAYTWILDSLGKIGWMVAFIYAACAALRLARFNVQIEVADKRYFTGLPSPSAAALVAGMVWFFSSLGMDHESSVLAIGAALVTGFAAVMMVSNVRYNSFKEIDVKGRVPFFMILVAVLAIAVISTYPEGVLWAIFLIYAISGPFGMLRSAKS